MQSTSFLREASILGIFSFWKVESDQGGVVPPPPTVLESKKQEKMVALRKLTPSPGSPTITVLSDPRNNLRGK